MLNFKDGDEFTWLNRRIKGVGHAYDIPNEVGGVAIDVGANVGAFGVVNFKKFNRIIALEPAQETYKRCIDTLTQYNASKLMGGSVEIYNLAVSSKNDEIVKLRHYKDDSSSGNAMTLDDPAWYRDGEYEEVRTISIEGIFDRFNLDKINYLKVDCEGAEYEFLMNKDLSKIDYIGIEIHIHLGEKANELMNFIEKTHTVINKTGDGKNMHYEITYKNKSL